MANRQKTKTRKAGERVQEAERAASYARYNLEQQDKNIVRLFTERNEALQDLGHAEMLRKSAEHDRQNLLDKNTKLQQQRDQYETQVEELRRTIGDHLETILKLTKEKESWVESVKDRDMQLESMVARVKELKEYCDSYRAELEVWHTKYPTPVVVAEPCEPFVVEQTVETNMVLSNEAVDAIIEGAANRGRLVDDQTESAAEFPSGWKMEYKD